MENVLLQLYNGEIFPADRYSPRLKEHREALRENRNRYKAFEAALEKAAPGLREQFREVMDEHLSSAPFETCEMFIDGFRLGARMILAVCREDIEL